MLLVLIHVLIICVVGAILFWVIDRFVRDARLGNLLKILVVLVCLGAILQRVLPLSGRRILVNSPGAQPNRAWQSAGAGRYADAYSSRRQTS
jgi:hypothetical protein